MTSDDDSSTQGPVQSSADPSSGGRYLRTSRPDGEGYQAAGTAGSGIRAYGDRYTYDSKEADEAAARDRLRELLKK